MAFLSLIGALLGPVAGVMITDYFLVKKEEINLDELYINTKDPNVESGYSGTNIQAYIATILGLIISISVNLIPIFKPLSDVAWITGTISGATIYLILVKMMLNDKKIRAK